MQLKRWLCAGFLSREFVRITDNKSRDFPKDFGGTVVGIKIVFLPFSIYYYNSVRNVAA